MKTCVNCGSEIEEKHNFCPQCGTRCKSEQETGIPAAASSENIPDDRDETEDIEDTYPMKWHKFLMVMMIVGGIVTIAYGINYYMGLDYTGEGVDMSLKYGAFPGLKICDKVYGIVLIALGVFRFTVRSRLSQYRANGPVSLKILYILSIVSGLVYLAWASVAAGGNLLTSSNMSSIAGLAILLIVNNIYYSRRSSLFVN